MGEQALDLRRSAQIVWRHKVIVGIAVLAGLLAGIAYVVLRPPVFTSAAIVAVGTGPRGISTEVVIAASNPVLVAARKGITPAPSLQVLRSEVSVKSLTPGLISISAQGKTAGQSERTANAVARGYVAYVSAPDTPGAPVQARILERAANARATAVPVRLLGAGGLGALLGALIGVIAVLAAYRSDRRLRRRGELANAAGAPVLASVPVWHPADAARWARLLEGYRPSAADALQLRGALRYLGRARGMPANGSNGNGARHGRGSGHGDGASPGDSASPGDGVSMAVFSLSRDRRALALGPQLAAFAASAGIPTALVIAAQQDPRATAALRAACAAPSSSALQSGRLRVVVAEPGEEAWREPGTRLTVIVAVVDDRDPQLAGTMRADATALGVSAGAATAEQLASAALSLADDGRHIDGILVADPDQADHTTGRVPLLARPAARRMPARLTTTPTETRR